MALGAILFAIGEAVQKISIAALGASGVMLGVIGGRRQFNPMRTAMMEDK
jgi:hypothetical protein